MRCLGPSASTRGFEAASFCARSLGALAFEDKPRCKETVKSAGLLVPSLALLERDKSNDLARSLRLSWSIDLTNNAAADLLPACSPASGPAAGQGVESRPAATCARWQGEQTDRVATTL